MEKGEVRKISVIFGTRPEAIKLAPVILSLRKRSNILCHVCVTAQHREMVDQVLDVFDIIPDVDLNIMQRDQSLAELTSRASTSIDTYLTTVKPDFVLVQGDTTTTFVASLVAFYNKIPVGHVEAGLRTGNFDAPWPEEANRVLTTRLASLHFAPTETNRQNLLEEGIPDDRIFVTGNTVIDALFLAVNKVGTHPPEIPGIDSSFFVNQDENRPIVLITGHRRESFGKRFESICRAIAELASRFREVEFVYPVHLNPNVRSTVMKILGDNEGAKNVHLIDPIPYLAFVALMSRAKLILTDSGGIQEEAPSLGKPVLVMRETTERPEAIAAGTARLVGTDFQKIVEETANLLTNQAAYENMAQRRNPYGDGRATERIVRILIKKEWLDEVSDD